MKLTISAACDIGCIRTNNEDMVLVNDQCLRDTVFTGELPLEGPSCFVAVSDGMGGHNAGELASEFVLQKMAAIARELPVTNSATELRSLLDGHVLDIHDALNQLGIQNPGLNGLGCTFTGLLRHQGQLYLVHVGDSRLYRQRRQFLAQLTKDHSLRNLLADPSIPPNKLANSFGGGAIDIFADFESLEGMVLENDVLLLCSDGLSGELSEEELEAALLQQSNAAKLVSMARDKGGRDNISCIVITVHP